MRYSRINTLTSTRIRLCWLAALLGLLLPALAACQGKSDTTPVSVVGYNHTDTDIADFTVGEGGGGGFLDKHSGGGGVSCCIVVPSRWRPGLKVEVSWSADMETYHTQTVQIPKYESAGGFNVHFLRNGEVKVFVTALALGHPDYPLAGPEAGLNAGENPIRDEWRVNGEGARK